MFAIHQLTRLSIHHEVKKLVLIISTMPDTATLISYLREHRGPYSNRFAVPLLDIVGSTVNSSSISRAAELIRAGRLVGFPTETVYGLGTNALDAAAVERIFEVKGRPKSSPLIVHVASIEVARELSTEWSAKAQELARAFWPGPLTLVVRKRPDIPAIVTAGLDTVGLRMPAHPVAIALLREAGLPIAAPSANRFTELSPVTAAHVRASLGDSVDMILDGGTCNVGIESTVLSLAGDRCVLLRPGIVSAADIEALVGPVQRAGNPQEGSHQSPGQHARHYRPRKSLYLVGPDDPMPAGQGAYLWRSTNRPAQIAVQMPATAVEYAARLYGTLHELDHTDGEWIAIERLPDDSSWDAVADRLRRAASDLV
jgi:L-threonylcarbamoyladenylate synthase